MNKKIRVIVLMGGKSSEHDVSLISGEQVVKHLNKEKYKILPVIIPKNGGMWQLKNVEQLLRSGNEVIGEKKPVPTVQKLEIKQVSHNADIVFIALHGTFGEDGVIQGMLEFAGIPYTGAGVLASAISMDKSVFKKIMKSEGIINPEYWEFTNKDFKKKIWEKFKLPLVVKPSSQGSSIGVTIVHKKEDFESSLNEALKYGLKGIVEEYISGTEITCGVLGNDEPVALPIVEIVPKGEFFDYKAKYSDGGSEEIVPARISKDLTKHIQETAIKVYQAVGCQGFGRVDMIISDQTPYVLEINTIPGLTPNSLLPKEAACAGINYSQLLDKIIQLGLEKNK